MPDWIVQPGLLDQLRYWVSVLVVSSLPGALAYWYLVHPLAAVWRRFGVRKALAAVFTLYGLSVVGLLVVRDRLVGSDHGTPHTIQAAIGIALLLAAMLTQVQVSRHLTRRILVGVPELSAESPGKLLTTGPYAWTRNPRYLVILVAMIGYSLLLNYSGVWWATVVCFPGLYFIILLEEKELRQRFGSEYRDYCRRVPRLLPRRPVQSV